MMGMQEFIILFSSLLHIFENAYIKKLLEMESIICTLMFITALCPIAKRWKQPMYPFLDKWINKKWCIHTMEYYSALKRKEILTHTTT